jgi:hypothetical protein
MSGWWSVGLAVLMAAALLALLVAATAVALAPAAAAAELGPRSNVNARLATGARSQLPANSPVSSSAAVEQGAEAWSTAAIPGRRRLRVGSSPRFKFPPSPAPGPGELAHHWHRERPGRQRGPPGRLGVAPELEDPPAGPAPPGTARLPLAAGRGSPPGGGPAAKRHGST